MLTAPPVLCCMGDRLGIPMNVFFFFFFFFLYQLSLSFYLLSSLSLHLHPNFCSPSFSYRSLCLHVHLFLSFVVLIFCQSVSFCVCLSPSLPLSLFELRAVSSSRSELCSHLSHHWGRRNIFYWCCPPLPLFCVRPFGFCPLHRCRPCCSQPLLFFLKSPFGQFSRRVHFPKMSCSYRTWGGNFSISWGPGWKVVATWWIPYLTLTLWLTVLL